MPFPLLKERKWAHSAERWGVEHNHSPFDSLIIYAFPSFTLEPKREMNLFNF